jgi:hypothetical protein
MADFVVVLVFVACAAAMAGYLWLCDVVRR